MECVTLLYRNGYYHYQHGTNYDGAYYRYNGGGDRKMEIISRFLTDDVGWHALSYKQWILDETFLGGSGNSTYLEKDDGYMTLKSAIPEDDTSTEAKM